MKKSTVIVLTGGPSSGKTAVALSLKKEFDPWSEVVPEAASLLFSGGFPRANDEFSQKCQQRAIYHLQKELEALARSKAHARTVICDRGSLDGVAYWPSGCGSFLKQVHSILKHEIKRYDYVVHLTLPSRKNYDTFNPLRKETYNEALIIESKILKAWFAHPRRVIIGDEVHFSEKIARTIQAVRNILRKRITPRQ